MAKSKSKKAGYIILGILAAVFIGIFVVAPLFFSNKLVKAFEKENITYTMFSESSNACNSLEEEISQSYPELGKVSLRTYGEISYSGDDESFTGMYYWFYKEDSCKAFYNRLTKENSNTAIVRKGKIIIQLSTQKLPKPIENVVNRLSGEMEKREIQ